MVDAEWSKKSIGKERRILIGSKGRTTLGRGRSRKRSQLYNIYASYHSEFLHYLTEEYRTEEKAVIDRISSSMDDPLSLEISGHALFDMYPQRRGNIFTEEVYRLVKANDATTNIFTSDDSSDTTKNRILPPQHKFSQNDVVMLTLQPNGSGDFFGTSSQPTNRDAISIEVRVLNVGPTYVDIACLRGTFERAFGLAPNDYGNAKNIDGTHNNGPRGNKNMRLRADRFFSNVPYERMVNALGQIASPPSKKQGSLNNNIKIGKLDTASNTTSINNGTSRTRNKPPHISLDETIRQAIVTTYGFHDPASAVYQDADSCNLSELSKLLARPPFPDSTKNANQVLTYMQSNPDGIFPEFNGPQLSTIGAALTRRLTMIQGPPGTGKTVCASSIAFGFVHQCRQMSMSNSKVLACAFSNTGADNLAEKLLQLGLKVIRVGKPSAVSPAIWEHTLDAAIDRDPVAQKALEDALKSTSNLRQERTRMQVTKGGIPGGAKAAGANERYSQDIATRAVKASIEACNIAATKALREADVVVCTSIGAADARLLAACGIISNDDEIDNSTGRKSGKSEQKPDRQTLAPDNLPPLSMPFVIVDEACQSVEPANLIPVMSTNSCRSLVLLGDPCQLPPTVISDASGRGTTGLSLSLMSRLASTFPHPVIVTAKGDKTLKSEIFLNAKPTKQAISLVNSKGRQHGKVMSYRKRYAGSLLLSIQYRMHPSISAFSSAIFYDGLLKTPSILSEYRQIPSALQNILPIEGNGVGVRFINIDGRNNEIWQGSAYPYRTKNTNALSGFETNLSYKNKAEALQIIAFLKNLLDKENKSEHQRFYGSIGIVTPYSSQVSLLKSLITSDSDLATLLLETPELSLEINSVDAYQGRERDIIIFSAVRSNRQGNIGFLSDWRRMNVALTRAKSGLVVFGDLETLADGDIHWEAFITWCNGIGCVFDTKDGL
mmetsp:Transcript_9306/g.13207  ORF Transcript_9306/g.13207 Transcript_9306/m.13207 type:complete len:948 (-) Transcript_9306:14-2857(-)